jgi:hypothetical protein
MEETSCKQSEAELAISLTGYDIATALLAIGFISNFIPAFKIKVLFPKQNIYSLVQIILNTRTTDLLHFSIVISQNPTIYEITPSDWFSFEKEIFSARLKNGAMEDYTRQVERNLKLYIKQTIKETAAISKNNIAMLIKTFFYPAEIEIKITTENLNLAEFKKILYAKSEQNSNFCSEYGVGFLNLDSELIEDNRGKHIKSIQEGDVMSSFSCHTSVKGNYFSYSFFVKKAKYFARRSLKA